jgi:glycosyltransferase involved in cell wall biosynthesis
MSNKTIGLCLIVKNEAHIITRCLEHARRLIDYVLIVDTGSSDGTQQVIRDYLSRENLPGQVIDEPWRDFAYNRTFALRALRAVGGIDYRLMIDADNVIHYADDFDPAQFKAGLTEDTYQVLMQHGSSWYYLPWLTSNSLDCAYRGVLHEFLECPGAKSRGTATGFWFEQIQDSARNRNPRKFQDDVKVLKKAIREETDPSMVSRYTFYLAQSYRDAGQLTDSLDTYKQRTQQGGWSEEVWYSLQQVALLHDRLKHSESIVLSAYLAAYQFRPQRAESLVELARYCRLREKYALARLFAEKAKDMARPTDILFLDASTYEWRALDEYAVASYWTGNYEECRATCETLLAGATLSEAQRNRIIANLNFARTKLGLPAYSEPANKLSASKLPNKSTVPQEETVNLVLVKINQHSAIFSELLDALEASFQELGVKTSRSENQLKQGAVNLLLGACVFDAERLLQTTRGHSFIVYQVEPLSATQGFLAAHPDYLELLRCANTVWDYSENNLDFLCRAGVKNPTCLPPAYHPSLECHLPPVEKDIDVFFAGAPSQRRITLLEQLKSHGLKVESPFGLYGEARNRLMQRSKILLNIHQHDGLNQLEEVRLSFLLANRCFVVSEDSDSNPYGGGVIFSPYEQLVDTCLHYASVSADARAETAEMGYQAITKRRMVDFLRPIWTTLTQSLEK